MPRPERRSPKLSALQKTSLRVVLQLADRAPGGGLAEANLFEAIGEDQVWRLATRGLLEIDPHGQWKLTPSGEKRARKIRRAWDRSRG